MTNIIAILAIAGAALAATQMFSSSSTPQIKSPILSPSPGPNGGGKRKTKKNRRKYTIK